MLALVPPTILSSKLTPHLQDKEPGVVVVEVEAVVVVVIGGGEVVGGGGGGNVGGLGVGNIHQQAFEDDVNSRRNIITVMSEVKCRVISICLLHTMMTSTGSINIKMKTKDF